MSMYVKKKAQRNARQIKDVQIQIQTYIKDDHQNLRMK